MSEAMPEAVETEAPAPDGFPVALSIECDATVTHADGTTD
jgi:hypothetical protein